MRDLDDVNFSVTVVIVFLLLGLTWTVLWWSNSQNHDDLKAHCDYPKAAVLFKPQCLTLDSKKLSTTTY